MYHENKAHRCVENLVWMREKLERLEGVRNKRISDLKEEIAAIESSNVTLICEVCGQQFTVPFSKYVKGGYKKMCIRCKRSENAKYVKYLEDLLTGLDVKYEYHSFSDAVQIPLPNKRVY
jgi:hypothetical protein